jgi:hypothetical protein
MSDPAFVQASLGVDAVGPSLGGGAAVTGAVLGSLRGAVSKGGAQSAKQAADLSKHLGYAEKYGKGGVKELESGRIRYYGEVQPSSNAGEMAGRRYVHEFDPATGSSRGWHESVDHSGNVRQVRPELNDGTTERRPIISSTAQAGTRGVGRWWSTFRQFGAYFKTCWEGGCPERKPTAGRTA